MSDESQESNPVLAPAHRPHWNSSTCDHRRTLTDSQTPGIAVSRLLCFLASHRVDEFGRVILTFLFTDFLHGEKRLRAHAALDRSPKF